MAIWAKLKRGGTYGMHIQTELSSHAASLMDVSSAKNGIHELWSFPGIEDMANCAKPCLEVGLIIQTSRDVLWLAYVHFYRKDASNSEDVQMLHFFQTKWQTCWSPRSRKHHTKTTLKLFDWAALMPTQLKDGQSTLGWIFPKLES